MANLRVLLLGLARTPMFAVVAIVSLALGIGANTAILSLTDQAQLRILPPAGRPIDQILRSYRRN